MAKVSLAEAGSAEARPAEASLRVAEPRRDEVLHTAGRVTARASADPGAPATPGEGDIVEAQKMVAFVQGTAKTIRRDIQVRVLANPSPCFAT